MAQFTPQSLARLLGNVEREVLVEALEIADLTQVLYPRHLQILDDLAGDMNGLYNLLIGPATEDLLARKEAAERALAHPDLPTRRFEQTGNLYFDTAVASVMLAEQWMGVEGLLATLLKRIAGDHEDPETANLPVVNTFFADQAVIFFTDILVLYLPSVEKYFSDVFKQQSDHPHFEFLRPPEQQLANLRFAANDGLSDLRIFLSEHLPFPRISVGPLSG